MYMCVRGINFDSFYCFSVWFWECSDSVVFFVFHFAMTYWTFHGYTETIHIFYAKHGYTLSCYSIFSFICMFCWSLFVFLYFSFGHCVVSSPQVFGGVLVSQSLVVYVYVWQIVVCPFVLFLLSILLYVLLRYTDSDNLPLVSSKSFYHQVFLTLMPLS